MFHQIVNTNKEQMALNIEFEVFAPSRYRLIVDDANQDNTILANKFRDLGIGKHNFYVRLPLVGNNINVIIYDEYNQNSQNFKVNSIRKEHLLKRLDLIDIRNGNLKSWILFAQEFCYNAGVLKVNNPNDKNDIYVSSDRQFYIKYLNQILGQDGTPIPTPASILQTGLIEVCSQQFIDFTVPMRMAILCHEYAHIYMNNNPENEVEADLNGLMLYLALGYPRYEACSAWIDTFGYDDITANDDNLERYRIMEEFIENFEKNRIIFNNRF